MNAALSAAAAGLGPLGLLAVAALSRSFPGARPRPLERALTLASWAGVLAAVLGAVALGAQTAQRQAPLLGGWVRVDALGVGLLLMVSLLVVVIARYSVTYLDGDPRQGVFLGRLAATAAAVEVLVVADHLLLFWLAWVATSACLHRLLVFYPERPRALNAARKKFVVARLGDLCLGAAFLLLARDAGSASLSEVLRVAGEGAPSAGFLLAGLLLALTAALKSAQFPTHGWLIEVMETPTPVSALLHAGVLNAGPFLMLRFAAVVQQAPAATWLLIVVGGFTALFASAALRTQPSVKVALGYSSAAHMGFMLFVCGLGVFPAAALHLVAHSFYKAHAFLSAGSVVEAAQAARVALPPRRWSPLRAAAGLGLALLAYASVAWALGLTPWEEPALLLVGAVLVLGLTQLLGAGLDRSSSLAATLRVGLSAWVVAAAFFGLEELSRRLLAGSLPPLVTPPSSALALGVAVVGAWAAALAVQLLGLGRDTALARHVRVHLRHGLYANALFDRLLSPPLRPLN
ncbi:MAG: proton-conducting transporter membrane subunit [Planctomycetota bacterium]